MDRRDKIDGAALVWMMRLRDGGRAEDWEQFTAWLEADLRHASAYEEAELADDGLDALEPAPPAPRDEWEPTRTGWPRRWVLGGGIAAALAAVIGVTSLGPGEPDIYAVETASGERRSVTLADGSRIDLNGGTRLVLDRDAPRAATIERGEALFTVVHDDARPFVVHAGDAVIRDMGTVFNVVRSGDRVEVGVEEGAVSYRQGRQSFDLQPGMAIRVAAGAAEVSRIDPEAVSGWREGRLTFRSAPLREVAADLARNVGTPVSVASEVAERPFTGVINLDGGGETIQRAALLMGVVAARRGDGSWVLTPGARETP